MLTSGYFNRLSNNRGLEFRICIIESRMQHSHALDRLPQMKAERRAKYSGQTNSQLNLHENLARCLAVFSLTANGNNESTLLLWILKD